jgi:hypothetical protein
LLETARKSATSAREFALGQLDDQVRALAARLRSTSASLNAVAEQLKKDPFVAPAAPLVEQAEVAVERAATYLDSRGAERIAVDLEAFSRQRPVTATLVATLVGFAVSRAIKASSVRRFGSTDPAQP